MLHVCIVTESPAKRDCQWPYGAHSAWIYKKHTATQTVMPEMRLEPLNVCLTDRRLNQLSKRDSIRGQTYISNCYHPMQSNPIRRAHCGHMIE